MQFKRTLMAAAVALAATSSHAAVDPFGAVDIDLFLSGASAVQSNFTTQFQNLFESSGSNAYVYLVDTTSSGTDYRAVVGKLKAGAISGLDGKLVRIVYRARGGSVLGVDPVARAEKVQHIAITGANCTIEGVPTYGDTTADYKCSPTGTDGANDGRTPDFGVSDVEPAMFQEPYNVEYDPTAGESKPQLSPTELAVFSGTVFPVYQQAFGVPITNTIATTAKIDQAVVASMMASSGLIRNWSQVVGSGQTANDPVVVCRRVQGSGTQATANLFFTGFPCNSPSNTKPTRMSDSPGYQVDGDGSEANPFIIDPSAGYTVVENPTSGNVRSCLSAAQAGTNHKFKGDDNNWYEVTFSGTSTMGYENENAAKVFPFGAVGVLSYDSAGQESGWHFHDLAGVLTNAAADIDASGRTATSTAKYALAAMIESPWNYFSEVTMQYRNATVNGVPVLAGNAKTFVDAFITKLGNPADMSLSTINKGIAALPANYVPTGVVTTNKVSKGSRGGDSCAPKKLKYVPQFWN